MAIIFDKYQDAIKVQLCKEKNITLIVVDSYTSSNKENKHNINTTIDKLYGILARDLPIF